MATEVDAKNGIDRYSVDDTFVFEPNLDGHRIMLRVEGLRVSGGRVKAIGRNGQASQHTPRFQDTRHAGDLARLAAMCTVVLDGELVGDKYWIFDMPELQWHGTNTSIAKQALASGSSRTPRRED